MVEQHFGFGDPDPDDGVVNESILIQLVELVEDNRRTSASRCGLGRRSENNQKMAELLYGLLSINEEEAEDIHWKYIKRLGE